MTAPDDALAAIEARGVQSTDDALAMADAIIADEDCYRLIEYGCDALLVLARELRSLRAHIAAEPERVAAAVDAATAAEQDIAHDVVWHAVLHHPLPWRVERDWTHEVTAKDGTIIAKCMTHGRAAAIVALAEAIVADLATDECADAIAATGGR